MNELELIANLREIVKENVTIYLRRQPVGQVVSVNWMEALARLILRPLAEALFEAWVCQVEAVAKDIALPCPKCGKRRKCKKRAGQPMKVQLLGLVIPVPKLYLECGHCKESGVSITRLLTGLQSWAASTELKLMAGYCGAEHSYGKASRDLRAHHGQPVERTAVRRMALEVEQWAMEFVDGQRVESLQRISAEQKPVGVERLMIQGDGGSVRTGTLMACEPGDKGYHKTTPKTGNPRRKRVTQKREIITLDMREPGQPEPKGLDVVVPCVSAKGERSRRMLALASRCGLGEDTEVLGLGDLGSRLPQSFDEAFSGYNATYSGDWKHVCDYVDGAAAVLEGHDDVDSWKRSMRFSIWEREENLRDILLLEAYRHRVKDLPKTLNICPVHALESYICTNWERMQAARFHEMGVDFVSARAEAQVRERTRKRYEVPGAWREENLECKATLRAIIDEGSWERFCQWSRARSMKEFSHQLDERLALAVAHGRIDGQRVRTIVGAPLPCCEEDKAA